MNKTYSVNTGKIYI